MLRKEWLDECMKLMTLYRTDPFHEIQFGFTADFHLNRFIPMHPAPPTLDPSHPRLPSIFPPTLLTFMTSLSPISRGSTNLYTHHHHLHFYG
ncbi:hypothetical protein BaRGS_00016496 [Batillaria attramentaria]|uniref:BRCT domain-containing protein n=1 Tax=Batillaria attramentaria TaxID=370345 RepID=A0ABD0KYE8_9CAEN